MLTVTACWLLLPVAGAVAGPGAAAAGTGGRVQPTAGAAAQSAAGALTPSAANAAKPVAATEPPPATTSLTAVPLTAVPSAAVPSAPSVPAAPTDYPKPWTDLGDHVARAFTNVGPLVSYAVAIGATAAMVTSGADQQIRVFAQREVHSGSAADTWNLGAVYGGYALPVVVPAVLYGIGSLRGATDEIGGGAAALQALGISVVTVTLLKVGTGRPFPNHGGDPNDPQRLEHAEYAREFRPFHFAGSYAWPSGHAAATISVAAALTAYYRGSIVVPLVAYPLAATIGLGMIVGDHHWGSDVVAGALIGQSIGYTVGSAFRRAAAGEVRQPVLPLERGAPLSSRSPKPSLTIVPLVGASTRGIVVSGTF